MHRVYFGDNMRVLPTLPSGSVDLIYVDPPFNTGADRRLTSLETTRVEHGEAADRVGFGGRPYRTRVVGSSRFPDATDNYPAFIRPRLVEAHRVLADQGTLYVHLDSREVHYCKVLLDEIFGRDRFLNEIVWAYDYGARTRTRWPAKHDNILVYVKDRRRYTFNYDDLDRVPYLAPGLVGPEKAARGKTPTDVWFQTIVSPTGKEKTGYPTQKPLAILSRIVRASSNPGDLVLDFFAGSGTTGVAAARLDRRFILVDDNPEAIAIMRRRLALYTPEFIDVDGDGPARPADSRRR
jgi:site-specific DNA-methyltransferase (adenine-specific)